jgi:hypothetical protein
MAKAITLTLTKAQYEIVSAALIDALCANPRGERAIRAAEKTQDVEPVAEGSEEMTAINEVIDDACNAFLNAFSFHDV